jgi:DNA polymerase (family 10)
LKELDIVVASVHSKFNQSRKDMTQRLINAINNDYVKIIGHPTSRKINKKKALNMDMQEIFKASKENNTYLEINSFPERLDLNDINVKNAIDTGCKIVLNTDAHDKEHLRYIKLGVAVAKRGWAQKKDVINTHGYNEFDKIISKKT